jgi:hypothetical protein
LIFRRFSLFSCFRLHADAFTSFAAAAAAATPPCATPYDADYATPSPDSEPLPISFAACHAAADYAAVYIID